MFERLNNILEAYKADGAVGSCLAVSLPGSTPFIVPNGLADRERGTPVSGNHLFKIGSCTKTFVAATLMMLAEDDLVDLDEPVKRWFPDLPRSDEILVRHLINHRSGLPEFEFDVPMTADRTWTPSQLVELAYRVRPQADPGRTVAYSNTGYVLAGMLIEMVTQDSLGGQVRKRILEPLGLADTWSPATESFPAERLVRGYYYRPFPAPQGNSRPLEAGGEMWRMDGVLPFSDELQDSTRLFPFSAAYACGDMVSTSADMIMFLNALFSGRLVSPKFLQEMTGDRASTSFPGTRMEETGAGLFLSRYAGRSVFGHQGSIPGYVTVMQHDPECGVTAALTSNVGSGNRFHFYASGLHEVFDQALATALQDVKTQV